MSVTTLREIAIEPIIHYPQAAEPGKSYLMTIDLRPVQGYGNTWPYEREEYVINCHVNAGDLFTVQPLGDATIILHRFGGTYGPARFVLTASEDDKVGVIKVSLINGWGVPLDVIESSQIRLARVQTGLQSEAVVSLITVPNSRPNLPPQLTELQHQLAQYKLDVFADHTQAISGGEMRDNVIITGDQVTYYGSVETVHIASAIFQAPPPPGQVAPKKLLWTYLNQIMQNTATVNLAGVDRRTVSEQDEAQLELAAVYTALDTTRSSERAAEKGQRLHIPADFSDGDEQQRQSALAFAATHAYTALLGDPGSGKTTFTNFLALCLAGELLGLTAVNLKRLGAEWTSGPLLPLRVVLRHFAAQLPTSSPQDEYLLWRFLADHLGAGLDGFTPLLRQHLLEEGGLLILDGLDEVPEAQRQRELVKAAISHFRRQFPRVRILLTSRTYAYQRQQWRLPDFTEAVLAPFSEEQIRAFVERWYAHMAQLRRGLTVAEAQGRATLLKDAIERSENLRALASRPLLLTLMASLHAWRGGSLPQAREQLYEESVELLLDLWERPKIVLDAAGQPVLQTESMAEWLRCPQVQVRTALEQLAYDVHRQQETATGTADIAEGALVAALMHAAQDPDLKPSRVIQYMRDRGGLLTNRGEGIYSFPHRAFQEYLAACYLTGNGFPNGLVKLVRTDPERWREVLLLAGAKVARGTPYAAWSLVARLCPQPCDEERVHKATESDWWAALLAGQLLVETGIYTKLDPTEDLTELETLTRVRGWLQSLVVGGHLSPVERSTAGWVLGWLGDNRRGVGVKNGAPDIEWIDITVGTFLMGDPSFVCDLITKPYRISRYPITIAQYQSFIDAGGYEDGNYWTKEGWNWRQIANVHRPERYPNLHESPTQPQIGVCWYEAMAFCQWLTEQTGEQISLPNEVQWERAARHTDGRTYPWGKDSAPTINCNMAETGIGTISTVGIFPTGNAVCGAADMSGNVAEWTLDRWRSDGTLAFYHYSYDPNNSQGYIPSGENVPRVVRGGSYQDSHRYTRCASRIGKESNRQFSDIGFRVVAVKQDLIASTSNEEARSSERSTTGYHERLINKILKLAPGEAVHRLAEILSQPVPKEERQLIQELLLKLDAKIVQTALITTLRTSDEGRYNATELFLNFIDKSVWQKIYVAIASDPTASLDNELYDFLAKETNNHPFLLARHAQSFIREIELTNAEQTTTLDIIKTLHEKLAKIDALDRAYYRTEPFGSQARHTAIRPISDIDALAIFHINPKLEGPKIAHEILDTALRQIYRKQTIINRSSTKKAKAHGSSFGASFIIQLPHIWLEVIPAVYTRDESKKILVPDQYLRRWIPTNHEIHAQYAQQQDAQTNGMYSALVKAVKWWHYRKSPLKRFLTGFMLECLIAENLDVIDPLLLVSFEHLMQRIQRRYRSPDNIRLLPEIGVPKSFKRTNFNPADFKSFVASVDKTVEQIQAISPTSTLLEKIESWQQIFGVEFPKTIVPDTDRKE